MLISLEPIEQRAWVVHRAIGRWLGSNVSSGKGHSRKVVPIIARGYGGQKSQGMGIMVATHPIFVLGDRAL